MEDAESNLEKCLRVRDVGIGIQISNLNLHMGKGNNSGSVGWVIHEYTPSRARRRAALPVARQDLANWLQRPRAETHALTSPPE